jgi:hypothetical protein
MRSVIALLIVIVFFVWFWWCVCGPGWRPKTPIKPETPHPPVDEELLLSLTKEDYDFLKANGLEASQRVHEHFYPNNELEYSYRGSDGSFRKLFSKGERQQAIASSQRQAVWVDQYYNPVMLREEPEFVSWMDTEKIRG